MKNLIKILQYINCRLKILQDIEFEVLSVTVPVI